jgi:hypothetical protein
MYSPNVVADSSNCFDRLASFLSFEQAFDAKIKMLSQSNGKLGRVMALFVMDRLNCRLSNKVDVDNLFKLENKFKMYRSRSYKFEELISQYAPNFLSALCGFAYRAYIEPTPAEWLNKLEEEQEESRRGCAAEQYQERLEYHQKNLEKTRKEIERRKDAPTINEFKQVIFDLENALVNVGNSLGGKEFEELFIAFQSQSSNDIFTSSTSLVDQINCYIDCCCSIKSVVNGENNLLATPEIRDMLPVIKAYMLQGLVSSIKATGELKGR